MCQRHILGHEATRMNENPFLLALATLFCARYELLNLSMELLAREQTRLDGALELALQHVELPAIDDDLVHLRPAGGIEFAACERDEGRAGLEPRLAGHDLARRGAADHDVGAAHDRLDRIHGHDGDSKRLRPFPRERGTC